MNTSARDLLESLFRSAVAAAHPAGILPPNLPAPPPRGRLVILAAGKAAGSMTEVAERCYLAQLPPDRLAGIEETRSSGRHAETLGPRIDAKGEEVTARRQEFFLKRVERRQAENLIEESEAQEAIEAGRRGQQALDDRYGSRLRHAGAKDTERPVPAAAWIASQPPAGSMDGEENESSKNKT